MATDHRSGDAESAGPDRVAIHGIAAGVSLNSLRALLDPATRESATVDLDLHEAQVEIPATVLRELVARFAPGASLGMRDDGLTVRPGGGTPGLRVAVPDGGVRARVRQTGVRLEAD